jgi:3-dehydroquinate synthase
VRQLKISGKTGESNILIGESLKNLGNYINTEKSVIITGPNVYRFYKEDFPECRVIEIGSGEKVKTLDTIKYIYEKFIEMEVDRSSTVVGIGGGVVCDIVGFVASTFMRGIDFGFVASSILAQVDASVGGKNGVNFSGYKNLVGVFNQPRFVICDINMLRTLPLKEVKCGIAEVVKYAAIKDKKFFEFLEGRSRNILSIDLDVMEEIVYKSVEIKSEIVNRDEKEQSERRKLNFGHTFGHAFERISDFSHGEAISIGMVISSKLSVEQGLLSSSDGSRIEDLLKSLKLPTELVGSSEQIKDAIRKDKKRDGKMINFVFLEDIGNAIVKQISISGLESIVDGMY